MQNVICEAGRTPCESRLHERNVSLDVLRVLCMFLIVLGHAMFHGHVLQALTPNSVNDCMTSVLRAFLSVHVNCFVLLSGYFLCTQEFRPVRFFAIWGQAFFWSAALYLLLCIGGAPFEGKTFLKACLPFTQKRYWFVTTYLLMYALAPLLNAAARAMSRRQHSVFLAVFFIIYIALQNLCFWERFTATDSYDPLFFAYLYMIAAYFRSYPARRTRGQYLLGYCAVCLFAAAWKLAMAWITNRVAGKTMGENMFLSYSSVTMVVASACLFRFFEGLHISGKIVRSAAPLLSSLTFGVYLIHEQPEVRPLLWERWLRPAAYAHSPFLIPMLFAMALAVFCGCGALEYLRQRVSALLGAKKLTEAAAERIGRRVSARIEGIFRLAHKDGP